jgi:hypothetical protein
VYFGSLALAALLAAAGCAKAPAQHASASAATARGAATSLSAASPTQARLAADRSFATLPDRGELLGYATRDVVHDGAYTWHRAGVSEIHALHAMANGHLRLTTPAGQSLDIAYDRHVEHDSGDWTWIGHIAGHPEQQTILTFGAHAAFGTIGQPDGLPLRLTVHNGASWVVETDPGKIALIDNAATRPRRPDFKLPPKRPMTGGVAAAGAMRMASAPSMSAATTSTSTSTVDLVVGYTAGFATANNGTSGAITRLNHLVDIANAAYVNSGISSKVRLVGTVAVSYPDASSNDTTLGKLTGYDSDSNTHTTPDPAFNALRAARETYGADLVSLVREYKEPENGGCGIAWLIGGGQSGISTGDAYFGYSVVSDGIDAGSDGKSYYCLVETLAHEMGHNMGAAHDVETAKGDDGRLDADEYGAYPYSFGYKTTSSTGNFYTVMAYGDTGQTLYRIFSDPRSTFCGSRACGTTTQADNARTLAQTIPIIAQFRAGTVGTAAEARNDFDADGRSDVLWRDLDSGQNVLWKAANSGAQQAVATVSGQAWKIVGAGDFDGNGAWDLLWRNTSTGRNAIWKSANASTGIAVTTVSNLAWSIVGTGDFNGDGRADILWRNTATGANAIWRSGNSSTPQTVTTITDQGWKVAAVADFNGDGAADILWRNASNGRNAIWRSGNSASTQPISTVGPDWRVAGAGDFNRDGNADVLWRNTVDGRNAIWLSANSASQTSVPSTATAWAVAAIGDYDGDGHDDVFWRNRTSGSDVIWKSADASTPRTVSTVSANNGWIVAE